MAQLTIPIVVDWDSIQKDLDEHDIVKVVRCEKCAIRYTSCPMVAQPGVVGVDRLYTEDDDYCSCGVAKGDSDAETL